MCRHMTRPILLQVPAGYRYRTLLVAADNVTSAMKLYGEILMKHYDKDHSYRKSDFSINNLGYIATSSDLASKPLPPMK